MKLVSVPESPPLGLYDTVECQVNPLAQATTCEILAIANLFSDGGSRFFAAGGRGGWVGRQVGLPFPPKFTVSRPT